MFCSQDATLRKKVYRVLAVAVLAATLLAQASSLTKPALGQVTGPQGEGLRSVSDMTVLIPQLVGFIDYGLVGTHIRTLSSLSRFTSYPGCAEAAEYVQDQLAGYGLSPYLDYYNITVPVDKGATLTVLGQPTEPLVFRVFPLLPNLVCPPATPGLDGPLVYVNRATTSDLRGHSVNGSVVLVDFNCEYEWLNAVSFGAKAILFIEPDATTSYEAESKRIYSPVNIPRFYVLKEDAERLMTLLSSVEEGALNVRLESRMVWENRQAANVVAFIPGTVNETIALFTFYDGWSVVPSMAYDADATCGVASWLEAARFFSLNKPYRNVLLVAFSGHWQTLAGGRAFIDKYFFGGGTPLGFQAGRNIRFALGFDYSTDSNVAAVLWGTMGGNSLIQISRVGMQMMTKCVDPLFYWGDRNEEVTRKLQEPVHDESLVYYMNKLMEGKVDYPYMIGDRAGQSLYSYALYPLAIVSYMRLETQTLVQIGGLGITVQTSQSYRLQWGLPYNPVKSYSNVNLRNLRPQAEFGLCATYLYVSLEPAAMDTFMSEPTWTSYDGTGYGWARFEGKVLRFDIGLGKYVEVPNALIVFTCGRSVYYEIPILTGEDASFRVTGFQPQVGATVVGGGGSFDFDAYGFVVNETTGNVEYAPDSGIYGARYSPSFQYWLRTMWHEVEVLNIPVFKCGSIVFHGLLDPISVDVRTMFTARVNEVSSHAELITYSDPTLLMTRFTGLTNLMRGQGVPMVEPPSSSMVLFIPPNVKAEVVMYVGPTLVGVVNNRMQGYTVEAGGVMHKFGPLEVTSDIILLNEERLGTLHSHSVRGGMGVPEEAHAKALSYFTESQKALEARDYADSFYYLYKCWGYVLNSYLMVKDMFIDTINSLGFISVLSITFAILFERLLFSTTGFRRAFTVILTFGVVMVLGFYLHPAYTMASNVYLGTLSISVILLLVPTIALLYSMASHQLMLLRKELRGPEAPTIDRLSAIVLSLSYGVSNMKKRRLRLLLTLTSIVVTVFGMTLLTSISSYTQTAITPQSVGEQIPYQGYELRTTVWYQRASVPRGLSYAIIKYVEAKFPDALIAPRLLSGGSRPFTLVWHNGLPQNTTSSPIYATLGLSVNEIEFDTWGVAPGSRWLSSDDGYECLVSQDVAEDLNISLGDTLGMSRGISFYVVGIVDPQSIRTDLDGESVSPRDFVRIEAAGGQLLSVVPHAGKGFMILPWKTHRKLGGEIMSVAIKPREVTSQDAMSLAYETGVHLFASGSVGGKPAVLLYSRAVAITTSGFNLILVPLVISAFILTNTMLGGIFERSKDIFTLSVVGLSPIQVFLTFLAEAIVYGAIGAFLGYIFAMVGANLALNLHLSGIPINFSSGYVVLSLAIAVLSTLIASILPFMTVSRIATPSLERRWKLEAPKGDVWEIRFPILISEGEMNGFLGFMKDFFTTRSGDVMNLYNLRACEVGTLAVPGGAQERSLNSSMDLLPPEFGISQDLTITGTWDPQRTSYVIRVLVQRRSGTPTDWVRRNTPLVGALRKHFLLWKTMVPEEKEKYLKR